MKSLDPTFICNYWSLLSFWKSPPTPLLEPSLPGLLSTLQSGVVAPIVPSFPPNVPVLKAVDTNHCSERSPPSVPGTDLCLIFLLLQGPSSSGCPSGLGSVSVLSPYFLPRLNPSQN